VARLGIGVINAAALMAQSGGYLSYIFDEAVAFETAASQASTGFSARSVLRLPSGTTVSAR
ncbi:MAG: hypothetical protein O7I42_01095, partial [Alphaproteobacteria bacterium]|nr:hypothetical protein [Alphaproteobacteria bacterium]